MTSANLTAYLAILAAAAAVPGPDIAAISARALSRGLLGTLPFISGIVIGHAIWTITAALGLVTLIHALGPAFVVVKLTAAAYLFYLAYSIWTAAAEEGARSELSAHDGTKTIISGVLIALSNPKAIVVFGAILPSIMPLETFTLAELGIVIAGSSLTLAAVFTAWAAVAAQARRWMQTVSRRRALNRISATVLAAAGVVVAAR